MKILVFLEFQDPKNREYSASEHEKLIKWVFCFPVSFFRNIQETLDTPKIEVFVSNLTHLLGNETFSVCSMTSFSSDKHWRLYSQTRVAESLDSEC